MSNSIIQSMTPQSDVLVYLLLSYGEHKNKKKPIYSWQGRKYLADPGKSNECGNFPALLFEELVVKQCVHTA